ncbi:hypothetical protein RCXUPER_241 [Rhodobacter phage RcXuper]|nr:hypothetical protein RCXUPER_241 [Rhodobacter phage RcXuper]
MTTIPHNAANNKSQAAAIMQAFRTAQIESNPAAIRAALKAAMTAKITNWTRM